MDNDLPQQIQKRIAELPEDVQEAIASADFDQKIQSIGSKHRLHIDQMEKLGDETMLVMLGFTNTADFAGNVSEHVGLPREQADKVVADINNDILGAIRESLKNSSAPTAAPAQKPTPATPPAPAPKPQVPMAPHPHDLMLVEKTVTTPAPKPPAAPAAASAPQPATPPPPKPQNYQKDPYREPVEP